MYVMAFALIFFISIGYTFNKLRGPGFNKEVRYLALKRHIITASFYLIANSYVFANYWNFCFIISDTVTLTDFVPIDTWWSRTMKIIFASQGFAIPILRLSEPYFYKIMATDFAFWWF